MAKIRELPFDTLNLQELSRVTAVCLQWCDRREQDGLAAFSAFRSPDLRAAAAAVFPDSCHTEYSNHLSDAFHQFLETRKHLVSVLQWKSEDGIEEVQRPKSLLLTDWRKSLFDSVLSAETDGFIDDDGMPPWDTWVALAQVNGSIGGYCLASWVPPEFSDVVNACIEVDAAECLSWLRIDRMGRVLLNGWGEPWAV